METRTKIAGVVVAALSVAGIAGTTHEKSVNHRVLPSVTSSPSLGPLPNAKLTPGVVDPAADTQLICTTTTAARRNTSAATKAAAYREYGAVHKVPGDFEVDHLIPLELGGADVLANLWPEPAPSFHLKDQLENRLHALVCAGKVPLAVAQHQIATDWVGAYRTYLP